MSPSVNLYVLIGAYICILRFTVIRIAASLNIYAFCCLQEGKEYLLKSVGLWLPAHKQSAASPSSEEDMQVSWSCASYFSDSTQPS